MKRYIFAPHLDDEVLGCFSILDSIDNIIYFTRDYREAAIVNDIRYIQSDNFDFSKIKKTDEIYIPSRFDYHPKHKEVNQFGYTIDAIRFFYSIEMNVDWLEEEKNPTAKREYFDKLYPNEDMKNDKYFLFKSIKPYETLSEIGNIFQFESGSVQITLSNNSNKQVKYTDIKYIYDYIIYAYAEFTDDNILIQKIYEFARNYYTNVKIEINYKHNIT